MNKIRGLPDKSDCEGNWEFINFKIDDYWLDEKLDEAYPDSMYKGLIPTLVYGIDREDEKAVVWKRILPAENETTICPILMCPDDCDFSCTLIVAEIRNCGEVIQWKKIGIDKTNQWDAEKVGTNVYWLYKIKELSFPKSDYLIMLEKFKSRLSIDKARIAEEIREMNKKSQ